MDCLAVNPRTGAFVREMRYIAEINFNHDADFDEVSFEEFITAVERYRAQWGLGEGTVKVLYETMYGIEENARAQSRRPSPEEKALLASLSKRTHPMFEEHLREQGLTGTPQPNPAPLRIARLFDSLDAS
ncbi:hypothetical protein BJF79_40755, partial [Actinomadura sp. CNU-125]